MIFKTRIAAIIINDGKILLQKGKGYENLWTPGGRLEEGESDEECIHRELKEELNVEVVRISFFKEYLTHSFYHPNQQLTERVYIVDIKGEIIPDSEIESVFWYTKDDFVNKTYKMIDHNEVDVIPDLIKEGIW